MVDINSSNSSSESLEDRLKVWEKEKRGLIDDLRSEREKRHTLEREVEEIKTALASPEKQPEEMNSQLEVNRLAAQPRQFILEVVKPEIDGLRKENQELRSARDFDQAYGWLAKQEKKDVEEIYESDLEKEIFRISREHNMASMGPVAGTKAAYKIYLQEQAEKKKQEAQREERIERNSTEPVLTTPSSTGGRKFTRQEIEAMSVAEYKKNQEAILLAQRKGWIS